MITSKIVYKEDIFEVRGNVDMRLPELIEIAYAQIEERVEVANDFSSILLLRKEISDLIEIVMRFHPNHTMLRDLFKLDRIVNTKFNEIISYRREN